jgi:hypothetical protein
LGGFEATFLSLIDMLREMTLGEWTQQITDALLNVIWPWPAFGDTISRFWRIGVVAIDKVLGLDLREAGWKLLDSVRRLLGGVDALGGWIYLGLVGLPTLIGSIFPGPGTAAGLGSKVSRCDRPPLT